MADIDIEKKKKPFWPWLLALLLLAVGVWVAVELIDTDEPQGVAEGPAPAGEIRGDENQMNRGQDISRGQDMNQGQDEEVPEEVTNYTSFVNDSAEMGLPHQYTSRGLMTLASALEAVVNKYDLDQQINIDEATETIRSKADFIQKNPESRQHADSIKAAFSAAERVLQDLENHYPDLESSINQLANQVDHMEKGTATMEQKSAVKSFFRQTQSVLKQMAENRPTNI